MRAISIKTWLIIFLSSFAIYLSVRDKDSAFLLSAFIATLFAVGADSLVSYLKNRKFIVSESSVISGLIIGYVLSSSQPLWIFLSACLFAIGSKHLIRINKKHIFNPAAFGLFSVILIFGASTQWRGTYAWHILVPAGLYFASRVRKIEVLIGYALSFLILFGVQAVVQRTPLLNILGYLSYFYIFVMVIEPMTTPLRPPGKFIFGIVVAALIFILTQAGVAFDAELCALLTANLFVPLLNKIG